MLESHSSSDTRPILLIDGLNNFVRHYAANPSMSLHGAQSGGVVGFLKAVRSIIDLLQPKQIVIAWESGGSHRRRQIFPDYKLNRRPVKLNRFYEDIPDNTENRIEQNLMLLDMLKALPICQVFIEDAEGDDVIAYLAQHKFAHDNCIIISSDRDFYQLLSDRVAIYTPDRKWIKPINVIEKFGVSAKNFAVAKAICGDPGDNIPGVEGIGFKRLSKKFLMLSENEEHLLEDVLAFGKSNYAASSVFQKVIDDEEIVKRNYRLVALDSNMLSANQVEKINYCVDTFEPKVNKLKFIQKLIEHGLNASFDVDTFLFAFRSFMMISSSSNKGQNK